MADTTEPVYPEIDFSFTGWVREAEIREVRDSQTLERISCENMDAKELVSKLRSGEYLISLSSAYEAAGRANSEIFDFTVSLMAELDSDRD